MLTLTVLVSVAFCLHIFFVYFVFVSVLVLYLLWFVMCNGRLMLESSASPPWIPSLLPSTTSPSARHFHYHHQHYVRVSSTYTHHSACTQQTTIANIPSIPIERGINIVSITFLITIVTHPNVSVSVSTDYGSTWGLCWMQEARGECCAMGSAPVTNTCTCVN